MIVFLNDRGEIITSAPVEVGRNSVNANEMIIVAPADSALASAVVYTAFRLPNGVEVFGGLATDESGSSIPAPADSLGVNIPEGQERAFVAWRQPIGSNLTKVSGIVGYTIYCVTESAKTSATGTFLVSRATTIDIPTTIPTVGAWEQISTAIAQIQDDLSVLGGEVEALTEELRADVGDWSDPERVESLRAAVEAAETDIAENAERISDNAESIEQLRANVGTRPMAGYTEADTLWSVIGNRPPIFARSTLYQSIYDLGELTTSLQDDFLSVKGIAEEALNNSEENAKSIEKAERALRNLYSVSQGVSYVDETVTSVAYEAPIPAKAAPWAHLDKVGGATTRIFDDTTGEYILAENKPTELRVMSKNLVPFPYQNKNGHTSGGVTFSVDDEGIVTANGEATNNAYFLMARGVPVSAGTYVLSGCAGGSNRTYYIAYSFSPSDGSQTLYFGCRVGGELMELAVDGVLGIQIYIAQGQKPSNLVFKPQFERGTTATAYTKPSQTISTTALPDLSDLDGWGQGVPSVGGNYITFTDEGKVMYQKTSYRYTFTGQEDWYTDQLSSGGAYFYARFADKPITFAEGEQATAICSAYEAVYSIWGYPTENCFAIYANSSGGATAYFNDLAYSTATVAEWKDYVKARAASGNPIVIEYALATLPDPIDITDRFNGFDGFIEGQGNGSVIVENNNKTMADLPTTISYIVSLRS